jgi:hypothetical protein
MEWSTPSNVHELCSFIGLDGYHKRFVEGFSKTVNSITNL